jgi:serine/threonine-protein kinase HipA
LSPGTAYRRYSCASRRNLLSAAPRFGLTRDEGGDVIDEIKTVVEADWRGEVLRQGGSERDCAVIEGAFSYPGFELP